MDKIIIHTGRLVKKNGISDLIKSLVYLPSEVKLQLLGGGEDDTELRNLVNKLNVIGRVEFLGHVPPEQVSEYLQRADIFCRPSLSEGLGISFLEAMGAGLPTIGTAVGGIPDFLKHHETGWICEVRNPRSIAEQIQFVVDPTNQVKVEEIVARARKLVEEKYNWDSVAEQMNQIFQKTLS